MSTCSYSQRCGGAHCTGTGSSRSSARRAKAFDLAEGTMYPALYRLEAAGLLASTWSTAPAAAAASTGSRRADAPSSPGSGENGDNLRRR